MNFTLAKPERAASYNYKKEELLPKLSYKQEKKKEGDIFGIFFRNFKWYHRRRGD